MFHYQIVNVHRHNKRVRELYLLGGVLRGSPSLGGFVASLLGVVLGSIGCLRGFSLPSRVGILSSIPCVSHCFVGIVPTAFQNTERSRREQQTRKEETKYRYEQGNTFPHPPVHHTKNPLLQHSYEHSSLRDIQVLTSKLLLSACYMPQLPYPLHSSIAKIW